MSNNNSFGGKLKKVLASMCSFVVGASGVSQAKFNVKDNISNVFYGDKKYIYDNGTREIFCDNGDRVVEVAVGGDPVVFSLGNFKHNGKDLESKFVVGRAGYGLQFRLQVKIDGKDQKAFDVINISWENVATLCSYWIGGDEGNLGGVNRNNFLDALGKGLNEINGNENYRNSFLFFFNFVFGLVTAEDKKGFGYDDIMEALKYLFRVSTTKDKFSPPEGVKYDDLGENNLPPEGFEICNYGDGLSYCMPGKGAFLTKLVLKLGENKVKKDLDTQIASLKSQVTELGKNKGDAETQLATIAAKLGEVPGFGVENELEKDAVTQTGNLVKAYQDLLTQKNNLNNQITTLNNQITTLNNQINDLNNQINDLKKFRYGTFFAGMAIPIVIGGAGFVAYKAGLFGRQGDKVRDIHGRSKRSNRGGNKVTKKPMRNSGGKKR